MREYEVVLGCFSDNEAQLSVAESFLVKAVDPVAAI
jgi:hypothetical protein